MPSLKRRPFVKTAMAEEVAANQFLSFPGKQSKVARMQAKSKQIAGLAPDSPRVKSAVRRANQAALSKQFKRLFR